MSINIHKPLLCALLLVAGSSMSPTVTATQVGWTVEELMGRLAGIDNLEVTFVEQRESDFLTGELVLTGRIIYRAPDYMEKSIESPYEEVMLIDGDTLKLVKSRNNGETRLKTYSLTSNDALGTAVEGIRATLAGDYDLLANHYEVELSGNCERWELTLVPRDEGTLKYVSMINVSGHEEQIQRIETRESDGDRSSMTFTYPPAQ